MNINSELQSINNIAQNIIAYQARLLQSTSASTQNNQSNQNDTKDSVDLTK